MYRFTIRDVMWFLAVAAIGLGWWDDHRRQAEEYRRLSETILSVGGLGLNFHGDGIVTYHNKAEPHRPLGELRPSRP